MERSAESTLYLKFSTTVSMKCFTSNHCLLSSKILLSAFVRNRRLSVIFYILMISDKLFLKMSSYSSGVLFFLRATSVLPLNAVRGDLISWDTSEEKRFWDSIERGQLSNISFS